MHLSHTAQSSQKRENGRVCGYFIRSPASHAHGLQTKPRDPAEINIKYAAQLHIYKNKRHVAFVD